jgi:homoserine O-acetyltransferase
MLTTLKTIYNKPSKPSIINTEKAPNKQKTSLFSQEFSPLTPFNLECGETLNELTISYHSYGQLNSDKSNVIWVCHALTADSNPSDWWPGLVGENDLFNPKEHFIICANVIGSPYGSTSPLKCEESKKFHDFPLVTIRDNVQAFILLKQHLGIQQINTLIGGSMGGHQALEWAIIEPNAIDNLILCATSAKLSAWAIAFNQSQRLAIQADQSWQNKSPKAGLSGLKAARSIALLSYRNDKTYNSTQEDDFQLNKTHKSISYQNYQGDKLVNRFNAFSYHSLTRTMDTHDVGRDRQSVKNALAKIQAKTLIISISSDILFPPSDSNILAENITNANLESIQSNYGHDGFLIESEQISNCIKKHNTQKSGIALFGLGCVGQGFYQLIKNTKYHSKLNSIYVKNTNKPRSLESKVQRHENFLASKDETTNTIIEVINDDNYAYKLLRFSVQNDKNFISANKKMISENLEEIIYYNHSNSTSILYEAAVAGSIPILRNLDSYFDPNQTEAIKGIINGSSNYILSQMQNHNWTYEKALKQAQDLGFAESNPYSDVSGEDAKYKAVILAAHGIGLLIKPEQVLTLGIQNISNEAIKFAQQNNYIIKQIAKIIKTNNKAHISVSSEFVSKDSELAQTQNENNLITVTNNQTDFNFKGAGAGSIATGTAVLADLKAIDKKYKYSFQINNELQLDYQKLVRVFVSKVDSKTIGVKLGSLFADFKEYTIIDTTYKKLKQYEDYLQANHFVAVLPE